MSRLWPRSLTGQMLLAVAVALLMVQGLGAFLIYRAQHDRMQMGLIHAAAIRLVAGPRGAEFMERFQQGQAARFRVQPRGLGLEQIGTSPLREGERRNSAAERQLSQILAGQGMETREVIVLYRSIDDDAYVRKLTIQHPYLFDPQGLSLRGKILVAAVKPAQQRQWLVARIRIPWTERDILLPLLFQTLVIYVVLVGAVAFILRRITRPLAALTNRVERFTETRDPEGQIEAEGPDDIRRLIVAHNGMEARISALLDEKDVMLGAIGHDLKTPLAALRVRIESVENDTERERMAATIEDIVRSLDDILFLARVGRSSEPPERSELSALIASLAEEYEDVGEKVELGETERIVLPVRPALLRRAVRNLIGNALRYGGAARVSLKRNDSNADIVIEDDGPGIPDEDIERMMDPFTRGEPSRNTETGGAGLGLTLARAIADHHGGKLALANRKDASGNTAGLTATLSLPVA